MRGSLIKIVILSLISAIIMPISANQVSANTQAYDLNFAPLNFQPEADLTRSNAELKVGFSRRYEDVATIGTANIDALVTLNYVTGHTDNEIATFDEYDNSQHLSFHTQINGTSTSQASARIKIQFLADGTNSPVVINNIRATIADIDDIEFARFYGISNYKLGSPTHLEVQTTPTPAAGETTFISSSRGDSNTDPLRIVEVTYDSASSISILSGCRANAVSVISTNGRCGFTITMGTVLLSGNTTSQAVAKPTYSVTYDANGATSGTVPSPTSSAGTITVANDSGSLTRNAATFIGWNTKADGTGLTFNPGSIAALDQNLTLYAQYSPYTATFHGNGASGTMPVQTSTETAALNANTFTFSGYQFNGWNTVSDGTGRSYEDGSLYEFTSNIQLYAQWTPVTKDALIHAATFVGNGASGTMQIQSSNKLTSLTANQFVRSGYKFTGWNTKANGTGTKFKDGSVFNFESDITLYAQWEKVDTLASTGANSNTLTGYAIALVFFGSILLVGRKYLNRSKLVAT